VKLLSLQPKQNAPTTKVFSYFNQSLLLSAVFAPNQRQGRGDDVCVTSS